MAGKLVKTKSGKTGRIKDNDGPVPVTVLDNSNPYMARERTINKVVVYFDDGSKGVCDPMGLDFIGFWD